MNEIRTTTLGQTSPIPVLRPKRLAITIASAVSLGSYEAGVLWEVLSAIQQHNEHDRTRAYPETRIVVDVCTGASAGGMTATILAQKLLFEGESFIDPYENPLYKAWVEGIDLSGLQATIPLSPVVLCPQGIRIEELSLPGK